jgi:glutathione S-transferase
LPVPRFMHGLAMGVARDNVIKTLNEQGTGDLTDAQYHEEFLADFTAAETLLERADFAVGDRYTHYDASVFAFLYITRGLARALQALDAARLEVVPAYLFSWC